MAFNSFFGRCGLNRESAKIEIKNRKLFMTYVELLDFSHGNRKNKIFFARNFVFLLLTFQFSPKSNFTDEKMFIA